MLYSQAVYIAIREFIAWKEAIGDFVGEMKHDNMLVLLRRFPKSISAGRKTMDQNVQEILIHMIKNNK